MLSTTGGKLKISPRKIMQNYTKIKKMMKNKLMLSYKFGSMEMGCCKRGGKNIPNASIASLGYSMAPTKMSMDMHMFGGMYAFGSNFTMMAMIPYVEKNMEMIEID